MKRSDALTRPDEPLHDRDDTLQILSDALLHGATIGIYIVQDKKITLINPQFHQCTGYSEAEMVGRHPLEIVVPEDRAEVRENAITMLREEREAPYEYRILKKDLSIAWVLEKVTSILYHGRRAVLGNFMDITPHKRFEQALRESEERYRLVTEHIPVHMGAINLEGKYTLWNRHSEEMFGYTADEMIGKMSPLVLHASPEDATQVANAVIGGETYDREISLLRKDGSLVPVRFIAIPQKTQKGSVSGFYGFAEDITARKEAEEALRASEEKYRILVESANEAIFVAQDERLKFANPKAGEMSGYSHEELTSRPITDFMHPDDRKLVMKIYRKILEGKTFPHTGTFRLFTKDGNVRWGETSIVLVNWEGRPAVLSFLTDVTRSREAEDEKERMQAQLIQAQKMELIGNLAGGVAHDFNNLLTVIRSCAEMGLRGAHQGQTARKYFQEVLSASERAANLIYQLSAFSRRQDLAPKEINLNQIILEMHKMLCRLIGEDVELMTNPSKDLGMTRVDPAQIEQVLVNLVVNARDAMPLGGRLSIETRNITIEESSPTFQEDIPPGDYVIFSVTDTGEGMTEEVKSHLFEPFFTTKEVGKGTGLGLATCYGIVKQSGGGITVASEPQLGSTFNVFLPRTGRSVKNADTLVGHPPQLQKGKEVVLLVEDDFSVRSMCSLLLTEQGYKVFEAANGQEALALSEEHAEKEIDLLLTDVVMPGIVGKELVERMRLQRPSIRVLFFSGYPDDLLGTRGLVEAKAAFLQKPFSASSLFRKVREVLDAPNPA